ncbi:hypothetical protein HNY73_011439 [Argiope bruennichi]|uniref:Uncharacterized protein n=1 Tax=Argiope bruennichi TaxID=94029 RepID=A0A8T0F6L3_ARGBR|nr:hypothetical protein HNY73_011439 [Argiope bruennichi]
MLNLEITEVGNSDNKSQTILLEVSEKDRRLRIDYHRLNKVTHIIYFPLPNLEDREETITTEIYITRLANISAEIRDRIEKRKQSKRQVYSDKYRRKVPQYLPGNKVRVFLHPVSSAAQKKIAKFILKRDGPYMNVGWSPTTYEVTHPDNPGEVLEQHHISALQGK